MSRGVVELPYPVRVHALSVERFEELWGVAAQELAERGPGFVAARAVDGAVLLVDLRGAVGFSGEERFGVVAGRVGSWMRSLVQRFFVDMAVVCLGRGEEGALVVHAIGGDGGELEAAVEALQGASAGALLRGEGRPVVGVGNVLPLDLLEQFAEMAGEWRAAVRARARRAVVLDGWRVDGDDLGRLALTQVAEAEAGSLAAAGVLAFPVGDGVVFVSLASLGGTRGIELEVAAQELAAVLGCHSAAMAVPRDGLVDVVVQLPIMHESGSFRLLGAGRVGKRVPFLGRNPLSFLADSPFTLG